MAGKVKLTAVDQKLFRTRIERWRLDELWIEKHMPDGEEFGNKAEILRNLGSAIAAGRAHLASSGKDD